MAAVGGWYVLVYHRAAATAVRRAAKEVGIAYDYLSRATAEGTPRFHMTGTRAQMDAFYAALPPWKSGCGIEGFEWNVDY